MFKFKVGDEVIVTAGRDRGNRGKVEKVLLRQNRLIVSGINIYKKHRKVTRNQPAGIYEIPRPIQTAKIAIVCPKCGQIIKAGFRLEGKTKIRICRKCQGNLNS